MSVDDCGNCACHAYLGLATLCNACAPMHGAPRVQPEGVERNDPWRPEQLAHIGNGLCLKCSQVLDDHRMVGEVQCPVSA